MKKGWQTATLGELCYSAGRIGWKGLTAKEYTKDGPYFLSVHGLNYGDYVDFRDAFHVSQSRYDESPEIMLRPNDVLLCKDGAGIGKVGIINELPGPSTINSSLLLLRSQDRLLPKYLYFALCSPLFQDLVKDRINGATTPHLYQRDIRELKIPLPNTAEQQRIVRILDEAFEGITTAKANTEKNLANARAVFESYRESVFSQRGDDSVETKLGDIGKVLMCKRIFKEETSSSGEIPFYKIGTFGREPDAYISTEKYTEFREKYPFPKKGAILISAAGTIGRRVKYDGAPAYFQDSNIVWIDNSEKQVLDDYLYHFYGACSWGATRGATISRLYNDDLRRIAISFPVSLQEQRRIVSRLDALSEESRRLMAIYEQKLATLDALKQSLLREAFSGRL